MNLNIYWPVFKNIEKEFENLLYNIHLDDNQLNVYSSKTTDLLLRTCSEIESISKELYIKEGGKIPENKYLNFENAIKYLNKEFKIENKSIIINSYNCFISNRIIKPFLKNTKRTGTNRLTYNWNNAYQNLKHNRFESIQFGNLENLLHGLTALFILNIYYKNESFHIGSDSNVSNFDLSLGSSIFSVSFHKEPEYTYKKEYLKGNNFDESVYLVIPDPYLYGKLKETLSKLEEDKNQIIANTLKEHLKTKDLQESIEFFKSEFSNKTEVFNKLQLPGIQKNAVELQKRTIDMRYRLELNKNQL